MTFRNGREMLDTLLEGIDLYCPDTETYVFQYNEEGSICEYTISREHAGILKKKDGYWSEHLGFGGQIYDDPSHELFCPRRDTSNLEWCDECFEGNWEDVSPKKKE